MTLAWLALAAACTPVEDLPLLPAEPTEQEVRKHVVRYCSRLTTCALGSGKDVECMAKMLDGIKTAEGRRGMGAMMNMFSDCMTMDCMSMSMCFAGKSARAAKDLIDKTPPPPPAPRTP